MKPLEVRWIVESDVLNYTDRLVKYLRDSGIPYKETNYRDVLSYYRTISDFLRDDEIATIFVGSLRTAREIKQYPVNPGVLCTLENFKCTNYYPSWNSYLLNDDWSITMKCLIEKDIKWSENSHPAAINREYFFRPDDGDKKFTGCLSTRSQIIQQIESNQLIIQAYKKNIGREYRFLVVDKEVISGCKYMDGHSINKVEQAKDYLVSVLKDKTLLIPDRAFTVDIGENLDDNKLGVIELNSFSCANLYSMNMEEVVPPICQLAKDMYCEANIDW